MEYVWKHDDGEEDKENAYFPCGEELVCIFHIGRTYVSPSYCCEKDAGKDKGITPQGIYQVVIHTQVL